VKPKTTRYADGAAVMEHCSRAKGNVLGFRRDHRDQAIRTERLAARGPLPADVQNYTSYDAALMTGASAAETCEGGARRCSLHHEGEARIRVRRRGVSSPVRFTLLNPQLRVLRRCAAARPSNA
jgi:hypothetical protein